MEYGPDDKEKEEMEPEVKERSLLRQPRRPLLLLLPRL